MLILSRRQTEKVLFPGLGITIEVVRVLNRAVRLGIDAPSNIRIIRAELEPTADIDRDDFEARSTRPRKNAGLQLLKLKKCLDAATLAIRLAQNQIRQQLNDNAEEALEHALASLSELQAEVVQCDQLQSSSNSVRESKSSYLTTRSRRTPDNCQSAPVDEGQVPWELDYPILNPRNALLSESTC